MTGPASTKVDEEDGQTPVPKEGDDTKQKQELQDCDDGYVPFQDNSNGWLIFGGKYNRDLNNHDRCLGASVLLLQISLYYIIWVNVLDDYKEDQVPVTVPHGSCTYRPSWDDWVYEDIRDIKTSDLKCTANGIDSKGLVLALVIISFFLTSDFQDAYIAFVKGRGVQKLFAVLVVIEVVAAMATSVVAATQKSWVGDIQASLEVGVGLLFVHDIGGRVFLPWPCHCPRAGARAWRRPCADQER